MEEGRRSVARGGPRVQRPRGTEGGGQVERGRGPGVESLLVKNLEKEEGTGVKIESCALSKARGSCNWGGVEVVLCPSEGQTGDEERDNFSPKETHPRKSLMLTLFSVWAGWKKSPTRMLVTVLSD